MNISIHFSKHYIYTRVPTTTHQPVHIDQLCRWSHGDWWDENKWIRYKKEKPQHLLVLFYKSHEQITSNFCNNVTNYKNLLPRLANKPLTHPRTLCMTKTITRNVTHEENNHEKLNSCIRMEHMVMLIGSKKAILTITIRFHVFSVNKLLLGKIFCQSTQMLVSISSFSQEVADYISHFNIQFTRPFHK